MATTPYFVLSPNTILSIIGLLHGADKTVATPSENWRDATIDVVIPALNEENNILLCLASLVRQTVKPRRIILIDDGSTDRTSEYAREFCALNGIELIDIKRKEPIGKTPTLKRQSREFDSDVEFILDGDTILESENYLERVVEELYRGRGVMSVCGTILPLRDRDRRALLKEETLQTFLKAHPEASIQPASNWYHHLQRGITDLYREVLYFFLQRFVYLGQMEMFGSILNPVGCAVAYRRSDLKQQIFDHFEPIMGDDLTNSEDIFIGFAINDLGHRNVQINDILARSQEPEATNVPAQVYLWSSSFLQSCYYFDGLMRSPFKAFKRWRKRRQDKEQNIEQKRVISEPYRHAFGHESCEKYGRPIGWVLFMSAFEKIAFPTTLAIMIILQLWEPLLITLAIEMSISLLILTIIAKHHRLEFFLKGLIISPLKYGVLLFDLVTIGRFASDIWIFKNKRWRK